MINKLLLMYMGYMTYGTTGLMPHVVGPPGSGKSTVARQLADLLGVRLHTISVARLNPLETEGIQMPHGEGEDMILRLLPAAAWERMHDGDIVLFDEFLRGFPEVYNALLDIFTSREVGGRQLPKVFMMAASNSISTYDPALEDRLLHIPVADPRKRKNEARRLEQMLVDEIGLHPDCMLSNELDHLMREVLLPTFDVLDTLVGHKGRKAGAPEREGKSLRNLIAQVQLRNVVTSELTALVEESNRLAMRDKKFQYVIVLKNAPIGYEAEARALELVKNRLTAVQRKNLEMNLQMLEMADAMKEEA